jgi:hypothetical protein
MRHAHRRSLLPHWIALLAVWWAALLPTLSPLLHSAGGDGENRVEICTTQGMRWVVLGANFAPNATAAAAIDGSVDGSPDKPHEAAHADHCPLCRLHTDSPPLPVSDTTLALAEVASQAAPALFLQAPRTLHAWRAAQPRGPPALS